MKYLFKKIRLCNRCILNLSIKSLTFQSLCSKSFSSIDSPANALGNVFGCNYHQAYSFVRKCPELKKIDPSRILKTAELLKKFDIGREELKKFPKVLTILPVIIEQHSLVLKESGFLNITAKNIVNYGIIVRRKISLLKSYGYIPESSDVSKNLLECLKAPHQVHEFVNKVIDGDSDDATISSLRDLVLGCYLQWKLDASEDEVGYIFSTYPRIRNKSLQLIFETLSIYLEELNFPKDHVKNHGYLIHSHPDDLRRILKKFPTLGGMPIRDLLYKHPIVGITSYETFSQIIHILRSAGISEEAILETPTVFTLSVESVRRGIALLDSEAPPPEIRALHVHPKKLRLVVHHDYVSQRLHYLNNCEHTSELRPVASLNLLCGSNKIFERYVTGIGGQSKGNDIVSYVSKALENEFKTNDDSVITPTTVRDSLKRHIHWRCVPLAEIQSCLKMLLKFGFTREEIMFSLQIVLYSSSKVKVQLKSLSEQSFLSEYFSTDDGSDTDLVDEEEKTSSAPKISQCGGDDEVTIPSHLRQYALPLCLYFLEKDHNFSGDGVWFRQ